VDDPAHLSIPQKQNMTLSQRLQFGDIVWCPDAEFRWTVVNSDCTLVAWDAQARKCVQRSMSAMLRGREWEVYTHLFASGRDIHVTRTDVLTRLAHTLQSHQTFTSTQDFFKHVTFRDLKAERRAMRVDKRITEWTEQFGVLGCLAGLLITGFTE
jgi:predicted GIY-YIG superfamily endonuclease